MTTKPRPAKADPDTPDVGTARILEGDPLRGDRENSGGGSGTPPPESPFQPRGGGGGRPRAPRWMRLLIMLVSMLLAFGAGWLIGEAAGRLIRRIEGPSSW